MSGASAWKDAVTVQALMARSAAGGPVSAAEAAAVGAADVRLRRLFVRLGRKAADKKEFEGTSDDLEELIDAKYAKMMLFTKGILHSFVKDFEDELASRLLDPASLDAPELASHIEILGRRYIGFVRRSLINVVLDVNRKLKRVPALEPLIARRDDSTDVKQSAGPVARAIHDKFNRRNVEEEALDRSTTARDAVLRFADAFCAQHRHPQAAREDWEDLVDFQTGELGWPEICARRGCELADRERLLRRQTRLRAGLVAFVSEALHEESARADAELALEVLDKVLRTRAHKQRP